MYQRLQISCIKALKSQRVQCNIQLNFVLRIGVHVHIHGMHWVYIFAWNMFLILPYPPTIYIHSSKFYFSDKTNSILLHSSLKQTE